MKFSAGNAQHIGAREQQQDSFGFSDPSDKAFVRHGGFLGVIADGMGGLSNGQEASASAVRSFLAAYQTKPATESVADALSRSLGEANRAVRSIVENDSLNDAGTTLAAAAVLDRELYWIAVGDSRIYWLHENELTQLTADHIYAVTLKRDVALGRISRSEAESHPEWASLTSYLGQPEPALTDRNVKPLLLDHNDCVLLCSDGFYGALSPDEIVDGFRGDPQHACDSLVELVISKYRKQQDNMTVIAFKARVANRSIAHISRKARLLLVGAACIILFSVAAALWFGRHALLQRSSPPAVPAKGQAPPVIVSQPSAPASVPPATTTPPAAGPPLNTGASSSASQHQNQQRQTAMHPATNRAAKHERSGGTSEASGPPNSHPPGQMKEPATPEPDQSQQAAPQNNAEPKSPAPDSSPDANPPSPSGEPTPQPPPSTSSKPEFARRVPTSYGADALPSWGGISSGGDHISCRS